MRWWIVAFPAASAFDLSIAGVALASGGYEGKPGNQSSGGGGNGGYEGQPGNQGNGG